jgi:hypothetical protein
MGETQGLQGTIPGLGGWGKGDFRALVLAQFGTERKTKKKRSRKKSRKRIKIGLGF